MSEKENTLSFNINVQHTQQNLLHVNRRRYQIYILYFIERKGIKILRHFKKLERSKKVSNFIFMLFLIKLRDSE